MRLLAARGILVIAAAFSALTDSMAEDHAPPVKPRLYQSPQSAFDAYRDACLKLDWRAAYSCLTPRGKAFAVYESYCICQLKAHQPKVAAISQRYQLNSDAIENGYAERYKKKHGVDPRAPVANADRQPAEVDVVEIGANGEFKSGKGVAPAPRRPLDEELFAESLYAAVKDGTAYYDEVQQATGSEASGRIERMDSLRVQGDTAVGRVTISTSITMISNAGGVTATTKTPSTHVQEFRFRKLNGSWLLDQDH